MELRRALTWHYMLAKRWHAGKVVGTLAFALAAPIVLFWKPEWGDLVGAVAGVWVLAGRTILSWLDRRHLQKAVTIQEQFDVDLFDLEWNYSLAGHKVAPEDIHTSANRVRKGRQLDRLRNCYPDVDGAVWPLNVLLCQRANAVWGRRGHHRYAYLIASLGLTWFIAGIVMAIIAHVTLAGYLVKVFLPSQPAFLDTVDLFRGHHGLSLEKESLENDITALWEKGVGNLVDVTKQDCRKFQDQMFRLRQSGMQIPQVVYLAFRKQDEKAMRAASARLLSSVPNSNGQSA